LLVVVVVAVDLPKMLAAVGVVLVDLGLVVDLL
jgi:hypothetical protein